MHIVRAADRADVPAIERLYRDAVAAATWLPEAARRRVDFSEVSQDEVVWVARTSRGQLAGFVSVYVPDSFIHHLFVAPPFQRRGVASSLLASLQQWLPLPWRLKCLRANATALRFYESLGWRDVMAGENEEGPYSVLEFARHGIE